MTTQQQPTEWTDLFNRLEDALGHELANLDFWTSRERISRYCTTMLKYFDKPDCEVVVTFNNRAFEVANKSGKSFTIEIPRIPICDSPEDYRKHIYARSILLRHELAHTLFSDTNYMLKVKEQHDIDLCFRLIEDARVEYLFSLALRGSRVGFVNFNGVFINEKKRQDVITSKIFTQLGCYRYFLARSNDIEFKKTPTIEKYEKIFQKYKWVLSDKDTKKVYDTYIKIADEVRDCEGVHVLNNKSAIETLVETVRRTNVKNPDDEFPTPPEVKDEEEKESPDIDDVIEESKEEEPNIPKPDVEEIITPQTLQVDTDAVERTENYTEEEKNDDDDNTQEVTEEDIEEEEEEEDHAINVEEDNSEDTAISVLNNMIQGVAREFDINDPFGYEITKDLKINPEMFPRALMFDLESLFNILNRNMYNPKGRAKYSSEINFHRKTINEIVRFLSLKLQNRNRTHAISNQLEGDLDQDNLKEIVINSNDPHAFVRKIKTVSTNSRIVMLIDGSGSMLANQLYDALLAATIIAEACKRLKLQYEIAFFTQFSQKFLKTRAHVSALKFFNFMRTFAEDFEIRSITLEGGELCKFEELTSKNNKNVEAFSIRDKDNSYGRAATVFVVKSAEKNHTFATECLLGNLLENISWVRGKFLNGGTPEFSAVINLYKRHKKFQGNKILMILNDGAYDNGEISPFMPYDEHQDRVVYSVRRANWTLKNKYDFERSKEIALAMVNYNLHVVEQMANDKAFLHRTFEMTTRGIEEHEVKESADALVALWKKAVEFIEEKMVKDLTQTVDETIYLDKENERVNIECKIYFDEKGEFYEIDCRASTGNYRVEGALSYSYNNEQVRNKIYAKVIDYMRNNGFTVCGFGIRADAGVHYIGRENFQVLNGSNDIAQNFSKKLMNIF